MQSEKVEVQGQVPLARFGHTITYINKGKAILFGGATGDTGKYIITGETYSFDLFTKTWKRVETIGNTPSSRAAHAAIAVEINQLVIYGGASGGGALASDDLYLLDMRSLDDIGNWTVVPVVGTTPGRRYGHTLTYTKPYLVVFGGNTGQEPVNDCWCLNVDRSPFNWSKIECTGEVPCVRVYHSAALCQQGTANGMVVIFGGRSNDQQALNDTFGLRRHRDGRWDWVRAPSRNENDTPVGRYQHSSLFLGSLLLVLGGRTNNVGEMLGMEIYDTETSEWSGFQSLQRFRHGSWIVENYVYIYGGFELDQPNIPTETITRINLLQQLKYDEKLFTKLQQILNPTGKETQLPPDDSNRQSPILGPGKNNSLKIRKEQEVKQNPRNQTQIDPVSGQVVYPGFVGYNQPFQNPNQKVSGKKFVILDVPVLPNQKPMMNKKITMNPQMSLLDSQSLSNQILQVLLQPKKYINAPDNLEFRFKPEHIIKLCEQAEDILKEQPMVLKVRAPLKIFGDIHGQYSDLMRFFDIYGTPYEDGKEGDIESFDYLFLGDFVDRGSHSLETICLLLALKIRYPDQVHLIRGNHEDKWINNGFGFSEECANRLGEDPMDDDSVFNRVNKLFEWLPLATIIEDKIICLHGGIGSSLHYVQEIEQLQRPLEVVHEVSTAEQQLVVDILWSDPTDSDGDLGIQPNIIRDPAGTGNIVKFGPDRVQEFLNKNNLSLIIRAHECVMDGFERFAGGSLITVFSATDYCGRHKNAGAVLILKNNFEIIPKLIFPSAQGQQWVGDRPPTPPRWRNNNQRNSYQ